MAKSRVRWLMTTGGFRQRWHIKDYKGLKERRFYNKKARAWETYDEGLVDPVIWVDFYFASDGTISSPKCSTPIQLYGKFASDDEAYESAKDEYLDNFPDGKFVMDGQMGRKPSSDAKYLYVSELKWLN